MDGFLRNWRRRSERHGHDDCGYRLVIRLFDCTDEICGG